MQSPRAKVRSPDSSLMLLSTVNLLSSRELLNSRQRRKQAPKACEWFRRKKGAVTWLVHSAARPTSEGRLYYRSERWMKTRSRFLIGRTSSLNDSLSRWKPTNFTKLSIITARPLVLNLAPSSWFLNRTRMTCPRSKSPKNYPWSTTSEAC